MTDKKDEKLHKHYNRSIKTVKGIVQSAMIFKLVLISFKRINIYFVGRRSDSTIWTSYSRIDLTNQQEDDPAVLSCYWKIWKNLPVNVKHLPVVSIQAPWYTSFVGESRRSRRYRTHHRFSNVVKSIRARGRRSTVTASVNPLVPVDTCKRSFKVTVGCIHATTKWPWCSRCNGRVVTGLSRENASTRRGCTQWTTRGTQLLRTWTNSNDFPP